MIETVDKALINLLEHGSAGDAPMIIALTSLRDSLVYQEQEEAREARREEREAREDAKND